MPTCARNDVDDLPPVIEQPSTTISGAGAGAGAGEASRFELTTVPAGADESGARSAPSRRRSTRRIAPVILLEQPVTEPTAAKGGANPNFEEWLERVPLLRGVHPRHIRQIARLGFEERFEPGDYVFRFGDQGEDIYIVLEGTIRILRNIGDIGEEALAILRPGHHFGEMSFLDNGAKRSADAHVQHGARVLRLPMRPLRDLMFVDRDLAHDLLWRFVRGLTKRVRDSNDRLTMFTSSARF